jgi:hypothetical protein
MESEQSSNPKHETEDLSSKPLKDQSKEEREKSFSRRALLQWSVPAAAAAGLAANAALPLWVAAANQVVNYSDSHSDLHTDLTHTDSPVHTDLHTDLTAYNDNGGGG